MIRCSSIWICCIRRIYEKCIFTTQKSEPKMHWSVTLFISPKDQHLSMCCDVVCCWFRCNWKWVPSIRRLLSCCCHIHVKVRRWRTDTTHKGQNGPSIFERKMVYCFLFVSISTWTLTLSTLTVHIPFVCLFQRIYACTSKSASLSRQTNKLKETNKENIFHKFT